MSSEGPISEMGSVYKTDSDPILNSSNLTQEQRIYLNSIFQKYDKDQNGAIDAKELAAMIRADEDVDVSDKVLRKLVKYSDKNGDGKIDADEFIDMVLDRKFSQLFGKYVKSYVDFVVPKSKRTKFKPRGRRAGTDELDGAYEAGFSCFPPPICLILVSIVEIFCFFMNRHLGNGDINVDSNGPLATKLVYDPERRKECWRYLTYMFVHIGWVHITMNLLTQVFLGLALELRNRWYRVLSVYTSGVVAGSLVTSIMDPNVYLAGASGGVYAIITAHLSNIIINWQEMAYPSLQLFIFVMLISTDVGTAIHNRYYSLDQTPIGYAAHFGGAIAGFLVGIWVLKNVEPTEKEKYLWWAAFVLYILLMGTAIMLNIFWTGHFLPSKL